MIKPFAAAIALLFTTAAQAYPTHCMRENGKEYVCHLCVRGHWPSAETYECSAREEARQERDRALRECAIDLTTVPDGPFKSRCIEISKRSP